MRHKKFELIKTTCKRCGKELYTGNRSLFGNDELKRKYDRICKECMTIEEWNEILKIVPVIK